MSKKFNIGARLALNGNNTTPNVQGPNDNDPAQKIQFIPSGNGYVLQRNGTNYSLSSNTLDYVGNNQNGLAMTTYTTGAGRWQNFAMGGIDFIFLYQARY